MNVHNGFTRSCTKLETNPNIFQLVNGLTGCCRVTADYEALAKNELRARTATQTNLEALCQVEEARLKRHTLYHSNCMTQT